MSQTFSSDKKKGQDLDTPYMEKIVNDDYIQKSVLGKRIIGDSQSRISGFYKGEIGTAVDLKRARVGSQMYAV